MEKGVNPQKVLQNGSKNVGFLLIFLKALFFFDKYIDLKKHTKKKQNGTFGS